MQIEREEHLEDAMSDKSNGVYKRNYRSLLKNISQELEEVILAQLQLS